MMKIQSDKDLISKFEAIIYDAVMGVDYSVSANKALKLLKKAQIDILNKAHRSNNLNDYDNETDEYIDSLVDKLEKELKL